MIHVIALQARVGLGVWERWFSVIRIPGGEPILPLNFPLQLESSKEFPRRKFSSMSCSSREHSPCHFREHSTRQVHSFGIHHTHQGNFLLRPLGKAFQVDRKEVRCGCSPARGVSAPKGAFVLPSATLRPLRPCRVASKTHTVREPLRSPLHGRRLHM